ncbi:MAG: hypothetical protein AAF620_18375 [Bacteroidota bacterium]
MKDIIQHMIDSKRVFAYRTMRFARNDGIAFLGFNQNNCAAIAYADRYALHDLLKYFKNISETSINLFKAFSESEPKEQEDPMVWK